MSEVWNISSIGIHKYISVAPSDEEENSILHFICQHSYFHPFEREMTDDERDILYMAVLLNPSRNIMKDYRSKLFLTTIDKQGIVPFVYAVGDFQTRLIEKIEIEQGNILVYDSNLDIFVFYLERRRNRDQALIAGNNMKK